MKTKVIFLASAVAVLLMACGNSQKNAGNNGTLETDALTETDGATGT